MSDLSQYIAFAVVLNKGQGSIVITDTGTYPAGIAPQLTGWFNVTQPDGLSVGGSATSPNVIWISGRLTQGVFTLRLDNANGFQKGAYIVTYIVRVPGFDDTVLTRTAILFYTPPVLTMSDSLDEFTPDLQVEDTTDYDQANWNTVSTTRAWSVVINSVSGSAQTIAGSSNPFDMNYQGGYYDALYVITLTAMPSYQSQAATWLTIIDQIVLTQNMQAQIPPTIAQLQTGLSALKNTLDATLPSSVNYATIFKNYNLANSLFDNLLRLGQSGQLAGLDAYVWQLQKIFNNNVNPTYVNTNTAIPAFDWGGGSGGSVAWGNITGKPSSILAEGIVGSGFLVGGASQYIDDRLFGVASAQVLLFRNTVAQDDSNLGDGNSYITKNPGDNFITFQPFLTNGERIKISIAPM